jgi:hypothetical protein
VSTAGVRHLEFPWSPEHELLVLSSPASATIAVRGLDQRVIVGAAVVVDFLRIDDELVPRPVRWRVERIATHGWHLRDTESDEERHLSVEGDGRPALADEVSWPLET